MKIFQEAKLGTTKIQFWHFVGYQCTIYLLYYVSNKYEIIIPIYIKKTFIEYYFITFHLSIIISRVYVYVSIKIGQKRQKCFWINLPFDVHVLF